MDISPHLKLVATLKRSSPTQGASGAFVDAFATVKSGVRCRIGQPARQRAVIGGQAVADLNPIAQFLPSEEIRDQDRLVVTGGTPASYVGTEWDLYSPVPGATPTETVYISATARRILTAAG